VFGNRELPGVNAQFPAASRELESPVGLHFIWNLEFIFSIFNSEFSIFPNFLTVYNGKDMLSARFVL